MEKNQLGSPGNFDLEEVIIEWKNVLGEVGVVLSSFLKLKYLLASEIWLLVPGSQSKQTANHL